jgi:hypothetical protein
MIQMKTFKALCCGAKSPAVMQSFTSSVTPHIGFLLQFFPSVILSTVIQNKGNHLISGTINAGVFLPRMTDVRAWDMALKAVVAGILKGNESALVVNNS